MPSLRPWSEPGPPPAVEKSWTPRMRQVCRVFRRCGGLVALGVYGFSVLWVSGGG